MSALHILLVSAMESFSQKSRETARQVLPESFCDWLKFPPSLPYSSQMTSLERPCVYIIFASVF